MPKIDLEPKNDREILIIIGTTVNDISDDCKRMNGALLSHEKRICKLEGKKGCEAGGCEIAKTKWSPGWQFITMIASVIALIIVAVGDKVNWW